MDAARPIKCRAKMIKSIRKKKIIRKIRTIRTKRTRERMVVWRLN